MRPFAFALSLVVAPLVASIADARPTPQSICVEASGAEAARCLEAFLAGDSAEPAFTDAAVRDHCSEDVTYAMGGLGVDDLVLVLRNACADFGRDWLVVTTPPAPAEPAQTACRTALSSELAKLRQRTIELLGADCSVPQGEGRRCRRPSREGRAQKLARVVERRIAAACGPVYENLGLPALGDVVATALDRARHFTQLVYPPNDLGPTSDLGPFAVGVRTLELVDPTRTNVAGTGPRPVTVEIWYPTTPETVAGVPRYVVNLFGLDVARTPTYRDVDRAAGQYPLVLFSHGNSGIRFQSIFLATHLASHGYVVASPDHEGNTFVDILAGVIDPQVVVNRPKDMTFLLDQLLARNGTPGDFLAGAIDARRIGMSGHSFGGFTTFALAAGGTKDDRIGAFMPLAPASPFNAAFMGSITKPILIQGGSLDGTTPFATQQEAAFELLPSGAPVVGLAELVGAGHFTFSDICEVPRNLVGAIGGFDEACMPEHLPWRHAHDIINYLSLNFFDAALSGDRKALRRLRPRELASIPDLIYRNK
jgi:predicted dienelactone hydrolase